MLKRFLLLINLCVALSASAEEINLDPQPVRNHSKWDSSISGFAYYRAFSDKDWHEDDAKIAANFFLGYGPVSASAQISKSLDPDEEVMKRMFLTGDLSVSTKAHFHVDVGRIPAFTSFYNNATDSPSAAGMALLPMAGYSHRMNNGMFTILDGHRLRFDAVVGNSEIVTFQYVQGEVFIENQDDMQREVFGQSPRSDVSVETNKDPSRAIAIKYENDYLIWFFSRNEYRGHVEVKTPNPTANFIAANFNEIEYILEKYGVRYFNKHFFIQGEYLKGDAQTHSVTGKMTSDSTSYDRHVIVGVNVTNDTRVYIGQSIGHSGKNTNYDKFIGATKDWGDWVLSVDYHEGNGHAWTKYDQDYSKPAEWKSVVSSLSYRFQ